MAKFRVHVGFRYTKDYFIEADDKYSAIDIAENFAKCEGFNSSWDFASEDYDAWETGEWAGSESEV